MDRRLKSASVLIVLILFSLIAFMRSLHVGGSDLAPSYFGCQLLAAGNGAQLYSRDALLFNHLEDPKWDEAAAKAGFLKGYNGPPYVQTPLWVWLLQPACTQLSYRSFVWLFLSLLLISISATIYLIARHWTPALLSPAWIALICLCVYPTEAFQYALSLTQTHMFFVFLIVSAIVLSRRHQPVWAGLLLAISAAVKITPGFLFLYWLVARQTKAAISFVVSSAVLGAVTIAIVGPSLVMTYLKELSRTSSILLIAFNNQSLAGWWGGRGAPATELFIWHALALPPAVKILSLLLSILSTLLGGWMDRRSADSNDPPYGAVFAILGATVFAPIAWTHYAVMLILPVMLLLNSLLVRRWYALLIPLFLIYLLNLYPFAYRAVLMHGYHLGRYTVSLSRSQFFSIIVAMAAIFLLNLITNRHPFGERSAIVAADSN
jgi:hypothetical protein